MAGEAPVSWLEDSGLLMAGFFPVSLIFLSQLALSEGGNLNKYLILFNIFTVSIEMMVFFSYSYVSLQR